MPYRKASPEPDPLADPTQSDGRIGRSEGNPHRKVAPWPDPVADPTQSDDRIGRSEGNPYIKAGSEPDPAVVCVHVWFVRLPTSVTHFDYLLSPRLKNALRMVRAFAQ